MHARVRRRRVANYREFRDFSLDVTYGEATRARRVDGRKDLWAVTVWPDLERYDLPLSSSDVTIVLEADRACDEHGAVCTSDGERLSTRVEVVVPYEGGSESSDPSELSVADAEASEEDDATLDFSVTLDPAADEAVTVDYATSDGTATAGDDYTGTSGTLTFDPGETAKTVAVPITDDAVDDGGETVTLTLSNASGATLADSAATGTIRNTESEPDPLTASFSNVPAEHTGGNFTFRLTFSEDFGVGYRTLRDDAFTVSGGDVRRARRATQGNNQDWNIEVEPDGYGAVTIDLPETTDCSATGAICTGDDRPLSHALSATVDGPVGISAADARVEEDAGAVLAFAVTLSRAAIETVTVDYATSDGSAQAGVDYTAASGTLTFQAGESSKTVEVSVLDDAHDEGEETFTLTLSNPSAGRLADDEATGTIENRDPLPKALLARFGRTAAVHVVEHVEERLQAPREPGFRGRFAGRELRRGMERDIALNFLNRLGGGNPAGRGVHDPMAGSAVAGSGPPGLAGGAYTAGMRPMGVMAAPMGGGPGPGVSAGPMGEAAGPAGGLYGGGGLQQMGLGGTDVPTGSAFALNQQTGHGGILSFWSRGAQSHFAGREGALSLGGDVRTTMFGADYAKGPVVAGLSLSHSRGLGHYAGAAGGRVASAVTGLYPWVGYKATDRITV